MSNTTDPGWRPMSVTSQWALIPPPPPPPPYNPPAPRPGRPRWLIPLVIIVSVAVVAVGVVTVLRNQRIVAPAAPTPGQAFAWAATIGGSGRDGFNAGAVAGDGTIVAAGETASTDGDFAGGQAGAVVARFSQYGQLMWAHAYGSGNINMFDDVAVRQDGRIVAVGREVTGNSSSALITCLNPGGTLAWSKSLSTSDSGDSRARFTGVAVAGDGSMVVVGEARGGGDFAGAGEGTAVVARFAAGGDLLWAKTLGEAEQVELLDVAVAPDGRIVVSGSTTATSGDFAGGGDFADGTAIAASLTADGEPVWAKPLGSRDTKMTSVAVQDDGTIVGTIVSSSADAGVASLTRDGDITWVSPMGAWKPVPTSQYDGLYGIATGPGSQIVAVGAVATDKASTEADGAVVTRLTSDGIVLWSGVFTSSGFNGVTLTRDGNIVTVGSSCSEYGDFPATKGGCDALVVSIQQ